MHRILGADSTPTCAAFLFWVHQLDHSDDVLAYLLKHGYCGKDFLGYLKREFQDVDFNSNPFAGQIVARHFAFIQNTDSFKFFPIAAQ